MQRRKKSLSSLYLPFFGLIATGLVLSFILHFGFMEPCVVDDPIQIVGKYDTDDLQDTSAPYWTSTAAREPSTAVFTAFVRALSFITLGKFLVEAILRLKLVRLNPSIGPPQTFFPG